MSIETVQIDKKRPTLMIATPMYGGMCVGQYAAALMLTPTILGNHGMGTYYSYMTNESLITRARNYCVDEFLRSDAQHLMFIDSDIGFNPQDIIAMMALQTEESEYDVIAAPYPKFFGCDTTMAPISFAIEPVSSDEPSSTTMILSVIFFNLTKTEAIFFSSLNAGMPITIFKLQL